MTVHFIPSEIVPIIHADLIKRYGGSLGMRDAGLLDSALAQPRMTFDGRYVHKTLFKKAVAYGFHLCKNHPFVDGNKRVAFVIMDMFLQKNGWEINSSEEDAYIMMIELAGSKLSKPQLSKWPRNHCIRLER
jgi:death-on-curing protein